MKIFSSVKQTYYDMKQRNVVVNRGYAFNKKNNDDYYGDIKKVNQNGDVLTLSYWDGILRESKINGKLKKIYSEKTTFNGDTTYLVLEINPNDTFSVTYISNDRKKDYVDIKKEIYKMTDIHKKLANSTKLKDIDRFTRNNVPLSESSRFIKVR